MITGILLLALVIFGLSWLFGFGRPDRLVKFIIWLLLGPLLLGLFYNEWLNFYLELPLIGQVIIIVAVPFFLLFALRVLFPASSGVSATTNVLWDLVVFIFTFPARLVWRSGRHITDKERNRIRLQRNRPEVGRQPPLAQNHRNRIYRGDN